jgi:hypothetical protein
MADQIAESVSRPKRLIGWLRRVINSGCLPFTYMDMWK